MSNPLRFAATTAFAAVLAQTLTAEQACESLAQVKLSGAVVTSATAVPSGTLPMTDASANTTARTVPARCVVKGVARPTSDSEIRFEVWLPVANWNGKYLQTGNGGWAGTIRPGAMVDAVERGYATAGTDGGHQGVSVGVQNWLLGHPEKLIDFAQRAVHETSFHAKALVRAFYGRDSSRSYFEGCSEGGREALIEAERYADDFDGIIAGSPALDWSHLFK